MKKPPILFTLVLLVAGALAYPAWAQSWPQYRANPGRTASPANVLADELYLQWTRQLPPQIPAWKDEPAMRFDEAYEPIAAYGLLFIGSTINDTLTAYDLNSGEERWRFYTEGPVRFAPAAWNESVFIGADDGCLYCLAAATGRLKWKFRAAPSDRRCLGNERLISTWPVRGGPVVAEGKIYFAAGVWPFMGVFIYALDAATGEVVWINDSLSFTFRTMPHPDSAAFAGLSPQGYLAIANGKLIVPGGRSNPAVLDIKTGELLFWGEAFEPQVIAHGKLALVNGKIFNLEDGLPVRLEGGMRISGRAVMEGNLCFSSAGVLDLSTLNLRPATNRLALLNDKPNLNSDTDYEPDGPAEPTKQYLGTAHKLGTLRGTTWLKAGKHLVTTSKSEVQLADLTNPGAVKVVWQNKISGNPASVLAADDKLIVVTMAGQIYCFGPMRKPHPPSYPSPPATMLSADAWAKTAQAILQATAVTDGYCLVWGLKDGGLVEELVRQSNLQVIAIDPDNLKVEALRRRLDAAGLYGVRATILVGQPSEVKFAPYLANLIVTEDLNTAGWSRRETFVKALYHLLRPYGGTACLSLPEDRRLEFGNWIKTAGLANAEVKAGSEFTWLIRAGALPGAAPWLGQNADAGNTRCSADDLVKLPLGVLWWGNALPNRLILPRHGEGPVEQIVGGRLFILGPNSLSAADVYTGRLLWTRNFPGLGRLYDSRKHQRR